MRVRRSFKFLLRPTSKQSTALTEMLRDHCSLYNGALQERRDAYRHISKTTVGYCDQSTQLKDIRANGRSSSQDLRQAAADLRSVMAAAKANETSLVRVLQQADSLMTRIQEGNGTLGMLATDSTLYRETTATVIQFRELLTDIQAHPKKYLKISVF